jgi:hypothetical protein
LLPTDRSRRQRRGCRARSWAARRAGRRSGRPTAKPWRAGEEHEQEDAAVTAARTLLEQGREDSARRAAALARELHVPEHGAAPPIIDDVDGAAMALTSRESSC